MGNGSEKDIVWHHASVTRERRERLNGHRARAVWFTGLSGAGKSTIAHAVEEQLHRCGCRTFVFDGDNVRHGLCGDLGFSPADRRENLRRIGEMAKLFVDAGIVSLAAFISPMRDDRALVREIIGAQHYIEIYVSCPLEECERRDVKGMYRRARAGQLPSFTGISAPYDAPDAPHLVLETATLTVEQSVSRVLDLIVPLLALPASA
ncbi:MAG: adenylyl-sulfate kinase [Rhodocyclaceae bacterium]|nr:adenylyl-sulfate kinase [Rhodocyclaceae bacterium]MBX3668246.1 adenylyl-sulfate kinase [Rhodocyclaceae bacterium]